MKGIWTITMSDRTMALLINLLALRVFADLLVCRYIFNLKSKDKGQIGDGSVLSLYCFC